MEEKDFKRYLKSEHLWAKKSLGQNFLLDDTALDRIADAGQIDQKDIVVEIGPGLGALTWRLALRAGRVIAIEKDETLAKVLLENKQSTNLDMIVGDVLSTNIDEAVGAYDYKVVANIPYYITSKIIESFLTRVHKPKLIVLLVQKEVAERICAKMGNHSVLSLSVQAYGRPEIVGFVDKKAFFPAPKVDSAILRIFVKEENESIFGNWKDLGLNSREELEKAFFRTIKIGFASKRKTLLNNLSAGLRLDKEAVLGILNSVNITDGTRAQELSLEQWRKLVLVIKN